MKRLRDSDEDTWLLVSTPRVFCGFNGPVDIPPVEFAVVDINTVQATVGRFAARCMICSQDHFGTRSFRWNSDRTRCVCYCEATKRSFTYEFGQQPQNRLLENGVLDVIKSKEVIDALVSTPLAELLHQDSISALCSNTAFMPLHVFGGRNQHREMNDKIKASLITTDSRNLLINLASRATSEGVLKLQLKRAKKTPGLGRVYGGATCAMMPKKIRAILFRDWVELDQQNSHPRHFLAFAKQTSERWTEVLTRLVHDRDSVLREISETYGIDSVGAKLIVLKIGYGGDPEKLVQEISPDNEVLPILSEYKNIMIHLANALRIRNPILYKAALASVAQKTDPRPEAWRWTILSLYASECETAATALACKWLIDNGKVQQVSLEEPTRYLMSPLHDGVWVKLKSPITPADLKEIEAHVKSASGFETSWGVKRPQIDDTHRAILNQLPTTPELQINELEWMTQVVRDHLPCLNVHLCSEPSLDEHKRLVFGKFRVSFVQQGFYCLSLLAQHTDGLPLFVEKRLLVKEIIFNQSQRQLAQMQGNSIAKHVFSPLGRDIHININFVHEENRYLDIAYPQSGVVQELHWTHV